MSNTSLRNARLPDSNYIDEKYQLNGVNQATPDELITDNEAAVALNCRMYAREANAKRVAIKTRKGPGFYSVPVGEAVDQQQLSVTGASTANFNKTLWIAQKFTAGSTAALTMVELNLKTSTATGTVLVDLYSSAGTTPGTLLATSGTPGSSLASSLAYVKFRFIQAPTLTSGTSYWIVVRAQDDSAGFYNVSTTTSTTLASTSNNSGGTYSSAGYSINFKVSSSTASPVLGRYRRYAVNGVNETLFAQGTSLYKINDSTGVTTVLKTGLNAAATNYRFETFNDHTIIVNGYDSAMSYNGTTVTNLTTPQIPDRVIAHKNRLFFTTKASTTYVFFSELADETTYLAVSFLYVPSPKSSDPISGFRIFQDNLVISTKTTKYVLTGSDLSSFTLRQAVGTKGAVSQEAMWPDRNFLYIVSDDGVYRWNGSTDQLISDKIQPEFMGISNLNLCQIIVWNNQLRLYYPAAGSAYSNKMAMLDLIYTQWFLDDDVICSWPLILKQDTGSPLVEFSTLVGVAYYAEQAYSALGKPISFKYWTSYNKYLSGGSKDRIRVFRPLLRPSGFTFTMQIGKDVDFHNSPTMVDYIVASTGATWGGGYKWGSGTVWGSSQLSDNKTSMSGRGKHTQYRFERYGANTPVELYGYIALIKSGRIG